MSPPVGPAEAGPSVRHRKWLVGLETAAPFSHRYTETKTAPLSPPGRGRALPSTVGSMRTSAARGTPAAIGLGGALALSRLLPSQLVNLFAQEPATIGVAAAVLATAALAAVLVPARHATRVEQLDALRG